jgi:hypothetical protein
MTKDSAKTKNADGYRPTKEERESIKKRFAEDKAKGLSFKDAYALLAEDRDKDMPIKEATAYGWWNSVDADGEGKEKSSEKKAEVKKASDVSSRLAMLLKKEGTLKRQFEKLGGELETVRREIDELWQKRQED